MTGREQTEHVLVCVECATDAPPGAVAWKAYLTVGDEDAEEVEEVAVYLPGVCREGVRAYDGRC